MFAQKKIIVNDEGLSVGKRATRWDDIIGIHEYSALYLLPFLRFLFPLLILHLRGSKSIWVYGRLTVEGIETKSYNDKFKDKYKEFFSILDIVSARAINQNKKINDWVVWRIIAPALLFQFFSLPFLFMFFKDLERTWSYMLLLSILLLIPGFLWEFSARKKHWT